MENDLEKVWYFEEIVRMTEAEGVWKREVYSEERRNGEDEVNGNGFIKINSSAREERKEWRRDGMKREVVDEVRNEAYRERCMNWKTRATRRTKIEKKFGKN